MQVHSERVVFRSLRPRYLTTVMYFLKPRCSALTLSDIFVSNLRGKLRITSQKSQLVTSRHAWALHPWTRLTVTLASASLRVNTSTSLASLAQFLSDKGETCPYRDTEERCTKGNALDPRCSDTLTLHAASAISHQISFIDRDTPDVSIDYCLETISPVVSYCLYWGYTSPVQMCVLEVF